MTPQATPVVCSSLSRPTIMAGGTLVMLAMVLMVTSGGLTTNSVVRPVTHAPVLSVLALPVHVEACFQVSLDDGLSGAPALERRVDLGELRSETSRLGEARLNLPPPSC